MSDKFKEPAFKNHLEHLINHISIVDVKEN